MAEWEHALNAYEVLGLAQGSKATDAEIGKVSLFCWHPPATNRLCERNVHGVCWASQLCGVWKLCGWRPVTVACSSHSVGASRLGTRHCMVHRSSCGCPNDLPYCWQAYRAAALRHHPDKNKGDVQGAKAKFQAAKDARDLLSDGKARAALDALLGCATAVPQRTLQRSSCMPATAHNGPPAG